MNWKKLFNERRTDAIYNVRLPITWTDRILEFAALSTNLAMWVVAAILYRQYVGQEVATHIKLSGQVDSTGDPSSMLFIAGMWTLVMLVIGFSAYRPRLINPPTKITTVKQLKLLVTQTRVLNIIIGIMGICILLAMVYGEVAWVMIPAILLFALIIVYSILIRKAR